MKYSWLWLNKYFVILRLGTSEMIHLEFSPKSSSLPIEILTLNYTFVRRRESDSDESTRNFSAQPGGEGKDWGGYKGFIEGRSRWPKKGILTRWNDNLNIFDTKSR